MRPAYTSNAHREHMPACRREGILIRFIVTDKEPPFGTGFSEQYPIASPLLGTEEGSRLTEALPGRKRIGGKERRTSAVKYCLKERRTAGE